jgi:hypothetical protein
MVPTPTWLPSIDAALLERLLRPLTAPGIISRALVLRVLATTRHFSGRIWLGTHLARRLGAGTLRVGEVPIVHGRWVVGEVREVRVERTTRTVERLVVQAASAAAVSPPPGGPPARTAQSTGPTERPVVVITPGHDPHEAELRAASRSAPRAPGHEAELRAASRSAPAAAAPTVEAATAARREALVPRRVRSSVVEARWVAVSPAPETRGEPVGSPSLAPAAAGKEDRKGAGDARDPEAPIVPAPSVRPSSASEDAPRVRRDDKGTAKGPETPIVLASLAPSRSSSMGEDAPRMRLDDAGTARGPALPVVLASPAPARGDDAVAAPGSAGAAKPRSPEPAVVRPARSAGSVDAPVEPAGAPRRPVVRAASIDLDAPPGGLASAPATPERSAARPVVTAAPAGAAPTAAGRATAGSPLPHARGPEPAPQTPARSFDPPAGAARSSAAAGESVARPRGEGRVAALAALPDAPRPEARPPAPSAVPDLDLDALVEQVQRKLLRRLAIERERRGGLL